MNNCLLSMFNLNFLRCPYWSQPIIIWKSKKPHLDSSRIRKKLPLKDIRSHQYNKLCCSILFMNESWCKMQMFLLYVFTVLRFKCRLKNKVIWSLPISSTAHYPGAKIILFRFTKKNAKPKVIVTSTSAKHNIQLKQSD